MSLATQIEEVMEPQIDNQLYDIPGFEGLYKITKDGRIYGNRDYSSKEQLSNMSKKRWERDLKPVEMYTKQGQYVKTFINAGEASKQTGIKRQYIVDVCNGKQKTTGEYIFKYMTGK